MDAQIVDFAAWKRAHPPALVCLNAGLEMALAWQRLWIMVLVGKRRKNA